MLDHYPEWQLLNDTSLEETTAAVGTTVPEYANRFHRCSQVSSRASWPSSKRKGCEVEGPCVAKRSQLFREYRYKTHAFQRFPDQYNAERLVYWESFEDVRNAMDREKQSNGCRHGKKLWLIEENELRLVRGPTGRSSFIAWKRVRARDDKAAG